MAIGLFGWFHAITELSKMKGSAYVSDIEFDELVKKVRQQEEAITQLLEIVAVTNRRLSELEREREGHYSFT